MPHENQRESIIQKNSINAKTNVWLKREYGAEKGNNSEEDFTGFCPMR